MKMNKERYNQIIDEVYENYLKGGNIKWLKQTEINTPVGEMTIHIPHTKEEFINKCKTDQEFSERWGLKIEERELSWEERVQWVMKNTDVEWENLYIVEEVNKESSPTKLITLQYKEEKIEVYE